MNLTDNCLATFIRRVLPAAPTAVLLLLASSAPALGDDGTAAKSDGGQQLVDQAVKLVATSIKNYLTKDAGVTEVCIQGFTCDKKLTLNGSSLKDSLASELTAVGISCADERTKFTIVGSVMAAESVGKLRFRATIIEGIRSNKTIEAQITDANSLGMLLSGRSSSTKASDPLTSATSFTSTRAADSTGTEPVTASKPEPFAEPSADSAVAHADNSVDAAKTEVQTAISSETNSTPVQTSTHCQQIQSRWPY